MLYKIDHDAQTVMYQELGFNRPNAQIKYRDFVTWITINYPFNSVFQRIIQKDRNKAKRIFPFVACSQLTLRCVFSDRNRRLFGQTTAVSSRVLAFQPWLVLWQCLISEKPVCL